jgi:NADPH2:quinone reductase
MKAVFYDRFGPAEVLQFGERPIPEPAADEVRVRIAAAAVNPIDRRLRAGELADYFQREFPIIPGWDFAGRIDRVGSDVRGFKAGDDVCGLAFTWFLHGGTYAEYACVKAESIAAKPAAMSWAVAASLPLVSLTAWQALDEFAQLKAGQSVLIQAGAGGVGSVAIPMAKHLGVRVITTASTRNIDYVRSRGADEVIDYTTTDYVAAVRRLAPGGLDAVVESLWGDDVVNAALTLVRDGGAVVYLNNEPPPSPDIERRHIRTQFLHHRADGTMLAQLVALYADGRLPLPEVHVRPLAEAVDAHRQSESTRTRGKVVLHVQDL